MGDGELHGRAGPHCRLRHSAAEEFGGMGAVVIQGFEGERQLGIGLGFGFAGLQPE